MFFVKNSFCKNMKHFLITRSKDQEIDLVSEEELKSKEQGKNKVSLTIRSVFSTCKKDLLYKSLQFFTKG